MRRLLVVVSLYTLLVTLIFVSFYGPVHTLLVALIFVAVYGTMVNNMDLPETPFIGAV
jgi:hypothetical protein